MVPLNEEWMEQWIAEAEKNVPVPMPANMKASVMEYVERKQQITGMRRGVFYQMRLCAAACMALVILAGTAAGLQRQEQLLNNGIRQEGGLMSEDEMAGDDALMEKVNAAGDAWFARFCRQTDTFASVMNEKMNAIVRRDDRDNQGGRE